MRLLSRLGPVLPFLAVTALAGLAHAAPPPGRLLVENVTLIDVTAPDAASARRPGVSVLVEGGRIVSVGPAGAPRPAGRVRRIDGSGRFLTPGFWDSHIHVAGGRDGEGRLALLLANGVVAARDMTSEETPWPEFRALQGRLERGEIAGPRLVASPHRVVNGKMVVGDRTAADEAWPFHVQTADEGRRVAEVARERGYDFLKPYDTVPRVAYFAMMERARQLGLPVGGHVPEAVSLTEALRAGQATIEHARTLPLACSAAGAARLAAWDAATAGRGPPVAQGERYGADHLDAVIDGFDPARCAEVFAAFRDTGASYVPTHLTRRMDAYAGLPEYRDDALLAYIPADARKAWDKDADWFATRPPEQRRALIDFYFHGLKLTGLAQKAGVRILAGTDAGDTYVFPGFGLHLELHELVAGAGLTPLEALRTATLNPARAFGAANDSGSVEPGKRADLVLLRCDPLGRIDCTAEIEAVVRDGRVWDRRALDGLLGKVRRAAR